MATNDIAYFPNVAKLLNEVENEFKSGNFKTMEEALTMYIRKRRYWPMIQTKKFFGNKNLVLLHNTYKRDDVDFFRDLYDEVRSVVLDLDSPSGDNVVVSLADKIPERLTIEEYKNVMASTDKYYESFEGTMIYVYYYNSKWFFSTSTCPNINSSKYFHPTKTHGEMFDETLAKLFPVVETEKLRETLVSYLDKEKSYGFLMVHHENKHVMDYTPSLGENYMTLYHVFTRDKKTSAPLDHCLKYIGIYPPLEYVSPEDALHSLENDQLYGIIVKTDTKVYKVSREDIIQSEKENLGNSNIWVNLLSVYMQQNPSFRINNYIEKYAADKKDYLILYDSNGNEMVPVYIIHTVIMTMTDILFQSYIETTQYDSQSQKYSMDKQVDASYDSIIRFHLAQLRHIQVSKHKYDYITRQTVYHYLCLHQTMKNMRMLIQYFANSQYNMTYKASECFRLLNNVLHE